MSLYDEYGFGDEYLVLMINSFLKFKLLREFINNTVAIQINDIRKLPIKIPSEKELVAFKEKFNECLEIKKEYFNDEMDRNEMKDKLRPIEQEIDRMVNEFYGIEESAVAQLEEALDEPEEEVEMEIMEEEGED